MSVTGPGCAHCDGGRVTTPEGDVRPCDRCGGWSQFARLHSDAIAEMRQPVADALAATYQPIADEIAARLGMPAPRVSFGDAPAGDECAAFSDVPLDTPMPPAFVEALASLSPAPSDLPDGDECFRTGDDAGRLRNLLAVIHRDGGHHVERVGIAQACVDAATVVLVAHHARDRRTQGDARERRAAEPGALDLDALHARLWSPTCSQCGAVDPPTEDAERWDGQRFLRHVDCPKPDDIYASEVGDHGMTRVEQRALVARVRELEAQLAAAQPAALRCAACSAEWPPDARDCPGCGHPDRAAGAVPDRDLCPKCGALDLDHVCPKSAATAAGEAFAAEHPEAAGRILG